MLCHLLISQLMISLNLLFSTHSETSSLHSHVIGTHFTYVGALLTCILWPPVPIQTPIPTLVHCYSGNEVEIKATNCTQTSDYGDD